MKRSTTSGPESRRLGGILRLLAILAAFAMVAAACGGSSSDAGTTSETTEDTETSEDAGDDEDAMDDDDAMDDEDHADDDAMGDDSGAGAAAAQVTMDQECEATGELDVPEGFKVILVTDLGKVDDGTFNQFAFDGMQATADCYGFETSFIETASEADYESNIATALEAEPNVIVTVGFLLASATMEAATANPDVQFIGVDHFQLEFPSNYIGVLFQEHEGGYMAGALAAAMSETGVVGIVAGREDVPPVVRFVNGFTVGATSVNPDVTVLSVYNESFGDPAKGASDAQQFIGEGADVIMGAGGPTGSGAVKSAAESGAWAIGVDQDEYFTTFNGGTAPGSDHLISSAMKRVDLGVFRNIVAAIDGSFTGGMSILTAENLGITYAPFHDAAVTPEAAAAVEAARAGLADGSIDTGVCGVDGLFIGEGSFCD